MGSNISIGNGGGGIWSNGRQLVCSCGNTTIWGDVTMVNDSASATCGVCGETATL